MRLASRHGGGCNFGAAAIWLRTPSRPLLNIGLLARKTRSTMLEALRQDYVRTARAKGLPRHLVIGKHALANAMIPITTVVGIIVRQCDPGRGARIRANLRARVSCWSAPSMN